MKHIPKPDNNNFKLLHGNFVKALDLMKKKNIDYADEKDFFKNFREAEKLGITVEQGILVRMSDKISRVSNLLSKKEVSVITESVEDTLIDLMNYANILLLYCQTEKE